MNRDRKLNYYEMKRRILNLSQLSKRNAEPEEFLYILKLMFNKMPLHGTTINNEFIYRARMNLNGSLFNNLGELKYPLKEDIKVKGRLNDIGESILYAALGELETLIEVAIQFNKLFKISTIKHKIKEGIFIPLGMIDREYSVIPQSKTEELLINYLNSEITKIVSNPIEYNSTIAIAHLILNQPVKNYKLGRLAGVVYPSVKSKTMTNVRTNNVAIPPGIFDLCFVIEKVNVYCLTYENTHYQLNEVNRVIQINSDGTLKWFYDFDEMKDRISKGLLVERGTCKNLIGVEKYI
jgi:hypothetical protein